MRTVPFQHSWSGYYCCGIDGDHVIGPYFLVGRLTGKVYANFLQNVLPQLIKGVLLHVRMDMWVKHDGESPYYALFTKINVFLNFYRSTTYSLSNKYKFHCCSVIWKHFLIRSIFSKWKLILETHNPSPTREFAGMEILKNKKLCWIGEALLCEWVSHRCKKAIVGWGEVWRVRRVR